MAWRAKIISKARDPHEGGVLLNVGYYDDANPEKVLAGRNFLFNSGTTRIQMLDEVKRVGILLRNKYLQQLATTNQKESDKELALQRTTTAYNLIAPESEVAL